MQNVVERTLNLLIYLLEAPRPVSADDVRRTVAGYEDQTDDAFHRMFERDKDVLRRLGVPIKREALDGWEIDYGYTVDPDEYAIDDPGLTPRERAALSVASRVVRLGDDSSGTGALMKLGGVDSSMGIEPLTANLGDELDTLGLLFGAISDHRYVQCNYRGHPRRIAPYGMAHRRGHWYLVGSTDTGQRMYRVDRMEAVTVDSEAEAFTRPRNFSIRAMDDLQPWEMGSDPTVTVTVTFDDSVAWWAARSLGIDVGEDEPLFTVEVSNVDAFIGWILSFGEKARVLGPEEVRVAIAERVRVAMESLP